MRILVAEDHKTIADNLVRGLAAAKYTAEAVYDGATALERASNEEWDLLVCDVGLPELDGLAVVRALRKQKNTTPILLLTARDTTDDKIAGLDAGADDYLVKPFELPELLARVRALLRRGAPTKEATLKVGNLTLDPAAHRVMRGRTEIKLAPREYALLEYLMRSSGQVKSRLEILDHVWGNTNEELLFSDTVDVHISYLRRKIDREQKQKLIHTIKGVGYKLEA